MADTKISALTNYVQPLDADVLPIVDIANTLTKKITTANLRAGVSFQAQELPVKTGTTVAPANVSNFGGSLDGTVMVAAINLTNSTTLTIYRYARDSTGNYYQTHSTTLTIDSGQAGVAIIGNFVYICATIGGISVFIRYAIADLTGVTSMTTSGGNPSGTKMFGDGTAVYVQNSNSSDKYTISGTTITKGSNITYTSPGNLSAAFGTGDATYAYLRDGNTANTNKYALAGGAVVSTFSPTFPDLMAVYPNSDTHPQMFFSGTPGIITFAILFNYFSGTTVTGMGIKIITVTIA